MAYPAGFTLISEKSVESFRPLPISSNAVTEGDLLHLAAGSTTWADGTSSTEHWMLKAVAAETVTTAATSVNAQLVVPGQFWVAETANNSAAADNGDRMVLTDTNTVNNTGTDSAAQTAVFVQFGTMGTAAEKRIWGIIVLGTGVDPDAT